MGMLVDGEWHDVWYDAKSTGGRFERKASAFRNWVTPDGAPGPTGADGLPRSVGSDCWAGPTRSADSIPQPILDWSLIHAKEIIRYWAGLIWPCARLQKLSALLFPAAPLNQLRWPNYRGMTRKDWRGGSYGGVTSLHRPDCAGSSPGRGNGR
jgi:hypothetical protein